MQSSMYSQAVAQVTQRRAALSIIWHFRGLAAILEGL